MTLTGAVNDVVGQGIDGAVGLLSGEVGQVIVFGLAISFLGLILWAVYYFLNRGKGNSSSR